MENGIRDTLQPDLLSSHPGSRFGAANGKASLDEPPENRRDGRQQRRLAAIVSADVVGYSLLMGRDDSATLAALKGHRRELIDPKITEYGGRIVKTTGDGLLLEFASVVDAVRCAIDMQRGIAARNAGVPRDRRIDFRIGINAGEIITENGDIFGDCVNVAARLQEIAEPGGICVSGRVHEDAYGKLDVVFEDAAERQLKNIARPVRTYRILLDGKPGRSDRGLTVRLTKPLLALPQRAPSAVLPLQTMIGLERGYLAEGTVDEIITALSRIRALFVMARNRAPRTRRRLSK